MLEVCSEFVIINKICYGLTFLEYNELIAKDIKSHLNHTIFMEPSTRCNELQK